MISGSADLTCAIWRVEQTSGFSTALSEKPIQMLYGHTACITAVAMYGDLDVAASGAKVCLFILLFYFIYCVDDFYYKL